MAWDRDLEHIVLVGGRQMPGETTSEESWVWLSNDQHGAGNHWTVNPPAGALQPHAEWERVEVRIVAGGAGEGDAGRRSGVRLLVWEEGLFHERASADAGLDGDGAPVLAPLEWSLADGERLSRLPFGDDRTLTVAVASAAPAGQGDAVVRVDYAELAIAYRLRPAGRP